MVFFVSGYDIVCGVYVQVSTPQKTVIAKFSTQINVNDTLFFFCIENSFDLYQQLAYLHGYKPDNQPENEHKTVHAAILIECKCFAHGYCAIMSRSAIFVQIKRFNLVLSRKTYSLRFDMIVFVKKNFEYLFAGVLNALLNMCNP